MSEPGVPPYNAGGPRVNQGSGRDLTDKADDLEAGGGQAGPGGFDPFGSLGGGGLGGQAGTFGSWITGMLGSVVDPTLPLEDRTVGEVVAQIAESDSATLSRIQRLLFQAGFYANETYLDANTLRWGEFDVLTQEALIKAAETATFARVDNFERFLEARADEFKRTGVTAHGGNIGSVLDQRAETVTLTDPDSIRLMAETAAQNLLGRNPTEQEIAGITESLHSQQRSVARQRADLAVAQEMGGMDLEATATLLRGEPNFDQDYDPQRSTLDGLDSEQTAVAHTIVDVAARMGLGDEYVIAALTAGFMESGLRNLSFGHGTSVGVYQQTRSSYGSVEDRMNVELATQRFFEGLLRADASKGLAAWVANVQRPAGWSKANPLGGNAARYLEFVDDAAKAFEMVRRSAVYDPRIPDSGGFIHGTVNGEGFFSRAVEAAPSRRPPVDPRNPWASRGFMRGGDGGVGAAVGGAIGGQAAAGLGRGGDDEEIPAGAFWFDDLLGGGASLNHVFDVDPRATVEMELRQRAPVDYESKQLANRAYEFFSMLGAGGGLV